MSVNVTTYESSLQTKLNATSGSTSTTDFLLLAKAVDALNTGAVITVANTGALPAAADSTGRTIYVTGESKLYFSTGSAWVAVTSSADVTAAITAVVNGAPGALDTLDELAAALGDDANFATSVTNALAAKAPLASPTFTGTVTLPSTTSIGTVSNTEIGYLDGVTSAIQTQLNAKAPTASPTFTGTVSGITAAMVGLGNVTNESKATMFTSPTFTGTVTLPSTTSVGNVSSTELGYLDGVTSAIQTQLNAKAPTASPTFTGTVSGITASMVGLGNVTNESKATMFASPTFTGTTTIAGLKDTRVAVAASAIDLSAGTYFTKTISATTTFTVSNTPSSGGVGAFILDLTNGGSSQVTFMTGTKWAGGTPPTLTASGRDVLGFFTHDGGTTWNGFVLGKALA
jgi:hypothetical protein